MIAAIAITTLGGYLLAGLLFAVPFVLVGVQRIDPHAVHGTLGFRLLLVPGTIFFWPWLAARWLRGGRPSPEENMAHRHADRRRPQP